MAKVSAGPIAADDRAVSGGPSANRIKAELKLDAKERGVVYYGDADHLYLYPPREVFRPDGRREYDHGLYIDFGGNGMTLPRFPEKNRQDREWCERVDEAIADHHPDCVQFNIRRADQDQPPKPCARWDKMSVEAIRVFVDANLEDDHEANVSFVKGCCAYEVSRKEDCRDDVLGVLDGMLTTEASLTSAFDGEITLEA
jgi:hypothetical protein